MELQMTRWLYSWRYFMNSILVGELIVVAIGALTNIALAIRLDPSFIGRLAQLYAVAGNIHNWAAPKPEYNAIADVEGYYITVHGSTPEKVTMIFSHTLDRTIPMTWRYNVLSEIRTKIMQAQNKFECIADSKLTNWTLLDPQAIALALNQNLIKSYECVDDSIILCGKDRGFNTNKFTDCKNANVRLAIPSSKEDIMNFLYTVFAADHNTL